MSLNDIPKILNIYESFFVFLFNPTKIIEFVKNNNSKRVLKNAIGFFLCNTIIIIPITNFLIPKQFNIKWIPLIVIIQCLFYIQFCIVPISFRNKKEVMTYVKIGITESFMVISVLIYLNIFILFLFFLFESYILYACFMFFLIFIAWYISVYFPQKIANYKKRFSLILTFISCFLLNYFAMFAISNSSINFGNFHLVDAMYEESIKTALQIIEYEEYWLNHIKLISELEKQYIEEGDKNTLGLLNKQIDLIIMKKDDISRFDEKIIFNDNKKELLILIEIIEAYERMKREINVCEHIPETYNVEIRKMYEDNIKIDMRLKQINQFVAYMINKETLEELKQIKNKMDEIQQHLNAFSLTNYQVIINNNAVEEICNNIDFVNTKVNELNAQTDKKMKYLTVRSIFPL